MKNASLFFVLELLAMSIKVLLALVNHLQGRLGATIDSIHLLGTFFYWIIASSSLLVLVDLLAVLSDEIVIRVL